MATQNGHEAVVARLLAPGVGTDPNQTTTTDGTTPLCMAAQEGHDAVAKLLLAGGADRTMKPKNGETAAESAARNGHTALAKLLKKGSRR